VPLEHIVLCWFSGQIVTLNRRDQVLNNVVFQHPSPINYNFTLDNNMCLNILIPLRILGFGVVIRCVVVVNFVVVVVGKVLVL
jgi:hypothetical protein